jgi:hypothetical protein
MARRVSWFAREFVFLAQESIKPRHCRELQQAPAAQDENSKTLSNWLLEQ